MFYVLEADIISPDNPSEPEFTKGSIFRAIDFNQYIAPRLNAELGTDNFRMRVCIDRATAKIIRSEILG